MPSESLRNQLNMMATAVNKAIRIIKKDEKKVGIFDNKLVSFYYHRQNSLQTFLPTFVP